MTSCDTCKRAPRWRLISGPTEMWGSNPLDISMVERRIHVPARLHRQRRREDRERSRVDRQSHINVFGDEPRAEQVESKPGSGHACRAQRHLIPCAIL
jgi:hypothetical protein